MRLEVGWGWGDPRGDHCLSQLRNEGGLEVGAGRRREFVKNLELFGSRLGGRVGYEECLSSFWQRKLGEHRCPLLSKQTAGKGGAGEEVPVSLVFLWRPAFPGVHCNLSGRGLSGCTQAMGDIKP